MKILMTWIGTQDLRAQSGSAEGNGPVANALTERRFDCAVLIADQETDEVERYEAWLSSKTDAQITVRRVELADPTDVEAVYSLSLEAVERLYKETEAVPELTFHLSPGTWAMATAWAIISETKFPAELIQSSREHGVKTVSLPFELSAELLPKAMRSVDARLAKLSAGLASETFGDLMFRSSVMARLATKAQKAAFRSVPVLIEGEVGTEKEAIARGIHYDGPRKTKPFVRLNCRSLDAKQLDDALFGNGETPSSGAWRKASGGTLFLSEVEALPLQAQVRLMELIDGSALDQADDPSTTASSVRVIASSRTNLLDEVAAGRFREELFFSLSVLVIKVPPLRDRKGDLGMIIDTLLERINDQSMSEPGYERKSLSPAARGFLLEQPWRGNVRELENTLRRAAVWSDEAQISESDVLDAIFSGASPAVQSDSVLGRSLEDGIDLQELIAEVARHYIGRAIEQAQGNKTTAAKLVGLPSYQTLSNWMKKYEIHAP